MTGAALILIGGMVAVILIIAIVAGQLELLYHRTHPPDDGTHELREDDDEWP